MCIDLGRESGQVDSKKMDIRFGRRAARLFVYRYGGSDGAEGPAAGNPADRRDDEPVRKVGAEENPKPYVPPVELEKDEAFSQSRKVSGGAYGLEGPAAGNPADRRDDPPGSKGGVEEKPKPYVPPAELEGDEAFSQSRKVSGGAYGLEGPAAGSPADRRDDPPGSKGGVEEKPKPYVPPAELEGDEAFSERQKIYGGCGVNFRKFNDIQFEVRFSSVTPYIKYRMYLLIINGISYCLFTFRLLETRKLRV